MSVRELMLTAVWANEIFLDDCFDFWNHNVDLILKVEESYLGWKGK
jgi:hypothetical protein